MSLPPPTAEELGVPAEVERVAKVVFATAFVVHRALGPGLRESVYRRALVMLLRDRGLEVHEEIWFDVAINGITFPQAGRVDVMVEGESPRRAS